MEGIILSEIDKTCPVKQFKVPNIREPWVTNEAIEAIRDKDRAMKRAKVTGREEDWALARRERNRVGRDLELLRIDFMKTQQEAHANDPRKFWRSIAEILPRKQGGREDIWLRDSGKEKVVPVEEIPSFINNFFTGIGPKLAKEHSREWEYFGEECPESLEDITTNEDEVLKLCKEINGMKASGFDLLSSRICKDAFLVLVDKLVHIFNCSLSSSEFPESWKIAKVVPLFKGGERDDVGNYRPVSLLPLPGKLLEKIVHSRIVGFLDDAKFLSMHQGGFRKGHSTTSTIADLTDELFEKTNHGLTTLAAFIDLKKAFDTVNQSILLKKLAKAGVRNKTLAWCRNYLTGRKQCILANGRTSSYLPIKCGVPQGSVLGPLFFLMYVNDLEPAIGACGVKLYADDTVLYQTGVNCEEAVLKLQISLNLFAKWCSANVLTLNVKKTKLMAFGSRSKVKKCARAEVTINNAKLQMVPSFKYLGFVLDPVLNFGQHVSSIIKTVHHKIIILSKVKRYLNPDVALKIYKTMVLPYFDYADVIYSKARAGDLDKLQRLQNRCLRLCLGHHRLFGTNQAHREAKVPLLGERRRAHTLNFMYQRKEKRGDLLDRKQVRTRARDAPLFNVSIPRCEAFKQSIGYHGATSWNELPPDIRNLGSYQSFKGKQKLEMLRRIPLN